MCWWPPETRHSRRLLNPSRRRDRLERAAITAGATVGRPWPDPVAQPSPAAGGPGRRGAPGWGDRASDRGRLAGSASLPIPRAEAAAGPLGEGGTDCAVLTTKGAAFDPRAVEPLAAMPVFARILTATKQGSKFPLSVVSFLCHLAIWCGPASSCFIRRPPTHPNTRRYHLHAPAWRQVRCFLADWVTWGQAKRRPSPTCRREIALRGSREPRNRAAPLRFLAH